MNIVVKGKHLKENAALEEFALKKAQKFYTHYPEIIKVEIELRSEVAHKGKDSHFSVDINVKVPGHTFKIVDQEQDMYKAVDRAVDRMNENLRREKGRHHSKLKRLKITLKDLGINAAIHLRAKRFFRKG